MISLWSFGFHGPYSLWRSEISECNTQTVDVESKVDTIIVSICEYSSHIEIRKTLIIPKQLHRNAHATTRNTLALCWQLLQEK